MGKNWTGLDTVTAVSYGAATNVQLESYGWALHCPIAPAVLRHDQALTMLK